MGDDCNSTLSQGIRAMANVCTSSLSRGIQAMASSCSEDPSRETMVAMVCLASTFASHHESQDLRSLGRAGGRGLDERLNLNPETLVCDGNLLVLIQEAWLPMITSSDSSPGF